MKGSKLRILDYMTKHNGITSRDAFIDLGVTRLSARIKELRDKGYIIDTVMMDGYTRFNEPCRYARYFYRGKVNE